MIKFSQWIGIFTPIVIKIKNIVRDENKFVFPNMPQLFNDSRKCKAIGLTNIIPQKFKRMDLLVICNKEVTIVIE